MSKLKWAWAACFLVVAAGLASVHAGETKSGFVNKIHKGKDGDVKYIVFVPGEYKGDKEYPVILFLHGAGESGTDGKKQAVVGLGKAIRDKKENFPFIAVFPQSQKGGWGAASAEGKRAITILDQVLSDYKTDKKRVYLTGLSMGGFGTWSMAAAHPNRWAAIAPVCGGGDPKSAVKFKDVPCWCFHGDADTAVKVEKSRDMIKALKDAGGAPRYDEYPKVGHNSWDRAYGNAELYAWFLKHSTR